MSGIWGGNEAELIEKGQGDSGPEHRAIAEPHEAVVMISHLGTIERELRRIRSFTAEYGRQFLRSDGGQAPASGTMGFLLEGPKSGNDWYVERLAVSVNAVVAAGIAALYEGQAADESRLIDMVGLTPTAAAPARGVLDGHGGSPYFIYGGGPVFVAVFGLVAGNPANVRLQGREVLSSFDPAMREQTN